FIGHQDALKPVLTVFETVAFWGGLRGGDEKTSAASLARFGLDHLANSPCRLLSAGQRKRVSLARLLASTAPLWLLDEPTSGLEDDVAELLDRLAGRAFVGRARPWIEGNEIDLGGDAAQQGDQCARLGGRIVDALEHDVFEGDAAGVARAGIIPARVKQLGDG